MFFIVFDCALLYVPILVFLGRRTRNFTVFGNEGCLELLYLLVVFHFLALNLGHNFLSIHGNILLHHARRSVDGVRFFAVKGRSWDLGPALHLRGQVPRLELSKLVLNLLLFFLCNWTTNIIVIDVLLR